MGEGAQIQSTTAAQNTAIGRKALFGCTTGGNNVALGFEAGDALTTGTGNVLIGQNVDVDTTGRTNAVALGSAMSTHAEDNTFRVRGDNGVYNTGNTSSWNTTSDERIKKNITDSTVGLAEINQIKVRNFEYRTASEITASELQSYNLVDLAINKTGTQVGCIAQELATVIPSAVVEDNRGIKNVQDDEIKWHLIKAIQDLSTTVDKLKAEIQTLKGE